MLSHYLNINENVGNEIKKDNSHGYHMRKALKKDGFFISHSVEVKLYQTCKTTQKT